MNKKRLLLGTMVIMLLFMVVGTVFASLADNVRFTVNGDATIVEFRNYNDNQVVVSVSIEYTDGNFIRFEHTTIVLGRKGFSSDTRTWSPPKGGRINDVTVKSVK